MKKTTADQKAQRTLRNETSLPSEGQVGAVVLKLVPAIFLSQLLGWLTALTRQIGL